MANSTTSSYSPSPAPLSSPVLPLPAATAAAAANNLNPIILIILLIVLITSLFSISLFRHLKRRSFRPAAANGGVTISTSSSAAASRLSGNRVSPEIEYLPVIPYSSCYFTGDCAVCLGKFERRDLLRVLPYCCHGFHVACIDRWIQFNRSCPLCRSPIYRGGGGGESFRLEIGSDPA